MKPTISELKGELEDLKKKVDPLNAQLIDERFSNIRQDINGLGSKLSSVEADIKDLQAFKNKALAYGSAATILIPIVVSLLMKLFS